MAEDNEDERYIEVEWIITHAEELKKELRDLALAGKPRPQPGTLLALALSLFVEEPEISNAQSLNNDLIEAFMDSQCSRGELLVIVETLLRDIVCGQLNEMESKVFSDKLEQLVFHYWRE